MSLFSAATLVAPLLPKLRGHFAEFLDNASPAGLGILSLSTCVGLRYGPRTHDSGFSRHHAWPLPYSFSVRVTLSACHTLLTCGTSHACTGLLSPGTATAQCFPAVLAYGGAGIFTSSPSATPLGLALGPDLPRADQLHPGNLGYPAWGIHTPISLLIPAFSLRTPPPPLSVRLLRHANAPLPQDHLLPQASAVRLSPVNFRRGTSRPVSYYALFECMAASEPTSWLSVKSHILSHLAHTLGP